MKKYFSSIILITLGLGCIIFAPIMIGVEKNVSKIWVGLVVGMGGGNLILSGMLLGAGEARSLKGYLSKGQVFKIIGYWKTYDGKENFEYFTIETTLNEIILLRRRPESNDAPPTIGYWYRYDGDTFVLLPIGTKT